jgi:hypothetical protein
MRAILTKLLSGIFVLLWAVLASALAQTERSGPLMGSEATPGNSLIAAEPADSTFRILVVGDGLAGGLGAGMTRMSQNDGQFEIINRFNESSGLARPEVYDWPNAATKIMSDRPVDAVVVLVGVNDRQDIRSGNFRYPFRSPDWVKGYEANVVRLLDAAKASSAKVFWVSIPPMADPVFNDDMRYLSEIHAKLVTAAGGYYVDVRPAFLAADGSYVDKGPDETGTERKLRSRDGITFFKQGNNRFGQLVLADIKKFMAMPNENVPPAVTSNVVTAKTAVPAGPVAPAAATGIPSFGQDGLDGEQITFRADAIQPADQAKVVQRGETGVAAITVDVKIAAKRGTAAQRMFTTGEIVAAPAGRFDDYAASPQP